MSELHASVGLAQAERFPARGRWRFGKTHLQTFLDAQSRAREKPIVAERSEPILLRTIGGCKVNKQRLSMGCDLQRRSLETIQNGTMSYSYKGIPTYKNPFDIALYQLLLWEQKPRTLIEVRVVVFRSITKLRCRLYDPLYRYFSASGP
jgi:hypothetical protein